MTVPAIPVHHRDEMKAAIPKIRLELERIGLVPLFGFGLFQSYDQNGFILSLTHEFKTPAVTESVLSWMEKIEDSVVDSSMFIEHREALAGERYRAKERIAELEKKVAELSEYKAWYDLEQNLLNVAASQGVAHVSDLPRGDEP